MSELLVEEKSVVVPGDILAKGMEYLPSTGTYRNGEEIIASKLGLVAVEGKVIKLIPLAGGYLPKAGDVIIGQVRDVTMSCWMISNNTAYNAMLNVKDATSQFIAKGADLTKYFGIGDYIVTKIVNVTSQMLIDLTMKGPGLKKLAGGQTILVTASKVPRIVGKAGSMVSMIKDSTKCKIVVGQNGVIWIKGEPKAEVIAVNTIRMIEEQAHVSGLTQRIQAFLDKSTKGLDLKPVEDDDDGQTFNEQYDHDDRRGGYSQNRSYGGNRSSSYGGGNRNYGGNRSSSYGGNRNYGGNSGGRRPPMNRDGDRNSGSFKKFNDA